MERAVSEGRIEGVSFEEIAGNYGTPCYVYSAAAIDAACRSCLDAAATLPEPARVSYAMKANGNHGVLKQIRFNKLGFDVSSRLEFERAIRVGAPAHEVVCTGPGKTREEIEHFVANAAGEIVCESEGELEVISSVAKKADSEVRVGVRVNPDIDPGTHPHVATGHAGSKFGVPAEEAVRLFRAVDADGSLEVGSLHCHIGSQVGDAAPYLEAADRLAEVRAELGRAGIEPTCTDLGGGYAVGQIGDRPKADVFAELCGALRERADGVRYGFQPGRMIVARSGILLTRALYRKGRHLVVDAGMTELIRPALYGAVHGVAHIGGHPAGPGEVDVVGPVCESADFLAKGVDLDAAPGELVAVFDAGAYARAMVMEFNGRLRPCEVLIRDGVDLLVGARQSVSAVISREADLKAF